MNTIQHHDNWPDTFKDPGFWKSWRLNFLHLNELARESLSPAGTPPETAPEGAFVPSGALVLRKLG